MKWRVKAYRVFADDCGCGLTHKYHWNCGVIGVPVQGYGLTKQEAIDACEQNLKTWLTKVATNSEEIEYRDMEIY